MAPLAFIATGTIVFAPTRPSRQNAAVCSSCAMKSDERSAPAVCIAAVAAVAFMSLLDPAYAISGGGKDFASKNWVGVDFSHGDYSGKDFSGGQFRGCSFAGSNLRGARMFKSELRESDMTGADLTGVSVEGAIMRDANLQDAIMVSSYIGETILDAGNITGVDFTDALISPESTQVRLCNRPDAVGVNPTTHVDTRESLMCPP